jgi:hypothetical protein
MFDRKTSRKLATALAAATLLMAAADTATAARAKPSPTAGTSTVRQGRTSPNYGGGHGWCYWHPYLCHYR